MNDGETKDVNNVYGKGTITAVSGVRNISMNNNALQSIGWSKQLLTVFQSNMHTNAYNINGTRQILPQYMLIADVAQLKENVHFELLWSDNTNLHTKTLNGKYTKSFYRQERKMNQTEYYKLLHGQGQRCPGTKNLLYIPKIAKSIEERSKDKICPPPQLNPEYKPNPKTRRCGQIQEPRPRPTQSSARQTTTDAAVLKRIFG
jgi:hypothetical protein